jgi:membrane protease YdiL (CAAX protease family)
VAIVGLILAAAAIQQSLDNVVSWLELFGLLLGSRRFAFLALLGGLLGLLLGSLCRWEFEAALLPQKLGTFALVAPVIGAAEEIIYRGYVQGRLSQWGMTTAAGGAALAHTCYKCALFALPPRAAETDFLLLAGWTFLAGLLAGALRELAGSVGPSIAAHSVFDVVVYGELSEAPWWVW